MPSNRISWNIVDRAAPSDLDPELPGDLRALAEQLTDDAAHLASEYPAAPARLVPMSSSVPQLAKNPTPLWRRAAAAAIFIALGSAGTWLAMRSTRPLETASVKPSQPRAVFHPAQIVATSSQPDAGVRELSFDSVEPRANLSELEMLRLQLTAFEKVIRKLQDELAQREKSAAQTNLLVESLRAEIRNLTGDDRSSQRQDGESPRPNATGPSK